MLLGDFKKCLLEHVVFYLNEKKVESLANAAVLADEFGLTHRSVFFFKSPMHQDRMVSPGVGRTRSVLKNIHAPIQKFVLDIGHRW